LLVADAPARSVTPFAAERILPEFETLVVISRVPSVVTLKYVQIIEQMLL
jgi:hypothetical protein